MAQPRAAPPAPGTGPFPGVIHAIVAPLRRWGVAAATHLPGGWRNRMPLVSAELVATSTAPLDAADAPRWVRLLRGSLALQVALLVAALLFALVFLRPLMLMFRLATNPMVFFAGRLLGGGLGLSVGRLLAAFGLGAVASRLLSNRRAREVCVWTLTDAQGHSTTARIALDVAHGFDLRGGDTLDRWGRRHHNGTVRTYHARNRRTGEVLEPRYIPGPAWVLLALTVAIPIATLTQGETR